MDKIDRLLDALEHPDRYTPTEIRTMLQDPEVKEMFDILDKTKSSLQTIVTPDIEEEWKRFENHHTHSATPRLRWLTAIFSRNAAASIAIGIASVSAMAAIVGVGIHHINNSKDTTAQENVVRSEAVSLTSRPDTINSTDGIMTQTAEIIIFDDETLEAIINRIATYYNCNVAFNNDAAKSLRFYFRWNQTLPLDEVVERLNNFEQIHITISVKTIKVD